LLLLLPLASCTNSSSGFWKLVLQDMHQGLLLLLLLLGQHGLQQLLVVLWRLRQRVR
jgi:hypothetical protein